MRLNATLTRTPGLARFYGRWVLANALSEGVGLGGTLLLGFGLGERLGAARPGPALVVFGALLAVLLGTLLEGVLVGLAQGLVLHERLPDLGVREWTTATAWGAGLAWLLGMLPSTAMALFGGGAGGAAPAEPAGWLRLALAAALGAALGPVLAIMQWRVLKPRLPPWRWLGANALAWTLGMVLLFAGMHAVAWDAGLLRVGTSIVLACTAAGALVGAVHGTVLLAALRHAA